MGRSRGSRTTWATWDQRAGLKAEITVEHVFSSVHLRLKELYQKTKVQIVYKLSFCNRSKIIINAICFPIYV